MFKLTKDIKDAPSLLNKLGYDELPIDPFKICEDLGITIDQ